MIKRNKLQARLAKARRLKFASRKVLLSRIVMRGEFKFDGRLNKPGILRRHYLIHPGRNERKTKPTIEVMNYTGEPVDPSMCVFRGGSGVLPDSVLTKEN